MALTVLISSLPTWAILIIFAVSLFFIVKGGDAFVDAACYIARLLKIPMLIIGATIVSIATTLPEVIVSVSAAAKGNVDMAAGNAIGSVTANTALVMAILLIGIPISVNIKDFAPKAVILFLSAAMLILSCIFTPKFTLTSSFAEGEYYSLATVGIVILALLCIAFFVQNILNAKKTAKEEKTEEFISTKKDTIKNVILFIVGAAGIVIGAQILVESGSEAAKRFGIEQRIISVIAFAIGTSLPELITAISALRKKESEISVGNIIGANIIDLTLILPLCALTSALNGGGTLAVPVESVVIDMSVCLITIAIAVIPTIIKGKFSRIQGVTMLGCYLAYVIFTLVLG